MKRRKLRKRRVSIFLTGVAKVIQLAMQPGFDVQLAWLVSLLGGFRLVRMEHFRIIG
jgi:hypothetical protein